MEFMWKSKSSEVFQEAWKDNVSNYRHANSCEIGKLQRIQRNYPNHFLENLVRQHFLQLLVSLYSVYDL